MIAEATATFTPIQKAPKKYTFEEYLRREEKSEEKHEFFNGLIIKKVGGTDNHSEICLNTGATIKYTLRNTTKKYRTFDSNMRVYVEQADTGLYPDALVICEKAEYWQGRRDVITNPLVIVEVLSPSTRKYDLKAKFDLYRTLPSFQEYILIDPNTHWVETRHKEEENLWRYQQYTALDATIPLKSLNIAINMTDIYENIEFL